MLHFRKKIVILSIHRTHHFNLELYLDSLQPTLFFCILLLLSCVLTLADLHILSRADHVSNRVNIRCSRRVSSLHWYDVNSKLSVLFCIGLGTNNYLGLPIFLSLLQLTNCV